MGDVVEAYRGGDVGITAVRVFATNEGHGREVVVAEDADLGREQARARRLFAHLGTHYGTQAQAAIRHALANPDLSTVVVGVTGLEQLDEALAAVQAGPPLPGAALDEVEGCCQEGF